MKVFAYYIMLNRLYINGSAFQKHTLKPIDLCTVFVNTGQHQLHYQAGL